MTTATFTPVHSGLSNLGLRERLTDGLNIHDGAMSIIRNVYAEYLVLKFIELHNEEAPNKSLLSWICSPENCIELYPDRSLDDALMNRLADTLKLQENDKQFEEIAKLVEKHLRRVLGEMSGYTETVSLEHYRDHFTQVRFKGAITTIHVPASA